MKTIKIKGIEYKHGDKIRCYIQSTEIAEARLNLEEEEDNAFICHNESSKTGSRPNRKDDRFGYSCGWVISKETLEQSRGDEVTRIQHLEPPIPKLPKSYKDSEGGTREVLGSCGRVIFLSGHNDSDVFGFCATEEELMSGGFTKIEK